MKSDKEKQNLIKKIEYIDESKQAEQRRINCKFGLDSYFIKCLCTKLLTTFELIFFSFLQKL